MATVKQVQGFQTAYAAADAAGRAAAMAESLNAAGFNASAGSRID